MTSYSNKCELKTPCGNLRQYPIEIIHTFLFAVLKRPSAVVLRAFARRTLTRYILSLPDHITTTQPHYFEEVDLPFRFTLAIHHSHWPVYSPECFPLSFTFPRRTSKPNEQGFYKCSFLRRCFFTQSSHYYSFELSSYVIFPLTWDPRYMKFSNSFNSKAVFRLTPVGFIHTHIYLLLL